ncbi:Nuclear movement protein [Entamoeba marina]
MSSLKTPVNNGAVYEKYSFTQTLAEVSVVIPYHSPIKGKDVSCKIKNDELFVQIKGETFIEGKLSKLVKKSDCCWTIEDKTNKIDTKQIQAENVGDVNELDDESRDMGLPTTEEIDKQKVLDRFKAEHPEYDFTQAKMM